MPSPSPKDHDIIITISSDMKYVKQAVDDMKDIYATKEEVAPVKAITYGLVGTIILTVLYAILAGVVVRASW